MAGRQMRGLADAIGPTMSHDTQVSGARLTSTSLSSPRNSNWRNMQRQIDAESTIDGQRQSQR